MRRAFFSCVWKKNKEKSFFRILFTVVAMATVTSANSDALRCNKVYNDNYYFGQTCILIDKIIDGDTNWDTIKDDPFVKTDQIKTVIFENSKVIYIPPQLFTKFKNVERVYVNGTSLETLAADSFQNVRTTKEIYLNQNNLREIGKGVFSKATTCFKLDLSNNQIEIIDDEAFVGLSQLRQLYLNSNRITTISDVVFAPLISINILDLSNNNIESFKDNVFAYNRQLQNISLAVNSIKILSLDMRDNVLIQTIDASSNVIEGASVQRKDGELRVLTVFVSHNQWQCDTLNATIIELERSHVMLKPKPNLEVEGRKSNVHGIECQDTSSSSFFNFDSSEINWPIVAFVIACSIVFIVGALVIMVCRRRSRLYNYIYVLSK